MTPKTTEIDALEKAREWFKNNKPSYHDNCTCADCVYAKPIIDTIQAALKAEPQDGVASVTDVRIDFADFVGHIKSYFEPRMPVPEDILYGIKKVEKSIAALTRPALPDREALMEVIRDLDTDIRDIFGPMRNSAQKKHAAIIAQSKAAKGE